MTNIEADIEAVESGYEFLLAYAAQGRPPQDESGPGPHPRPELEKMLEAMKNATRALGEKLTDFEQVLVDDLRKARAAVEFVLAQPKIGSEVIDNLNASIHVRAMLTDFFLYSEAFRPATGTVPTTPPPSTQWDKVGN